MKRSLWLLVMSCAVWVTAGCGHVDLAPETDPNRVVTGTVNVRMDLTPPPGAEVVVRLVEPPDVTAAPTAASRDLVIGERGTRTQPEKVVAEQVIRSPSGMPVPFRIEYRASEATMQRGLNIAARISWDKRLRFRTMSAQVVTLATANEPQTVWVEALP